MALKKRVVTRTNVGAVVCDCAFYQTIFETTGIAMAIIRKDTTIALVNAGFEILSGFKKAEIEGKKSWIEFVAERDAERMLAYHRLWRIQRSTVPRNCEFQFVDREGRMRDILVTADVIADTGLIVMSFLDVTVYKRTESALRKAEEKYRGLVENLDDVIFTLDEHGRFNYVSPVIERMSGYRADEVVGECLTRFVHPEDVAGLLSWAEEVFSGRGGEKEFRLMEKDGRVRHVRVSARPLPECGRTVGLAGIMLDITERWKARQRIRRYQNRLRSLAAELARAEERERRRIAAELHDHIGHTLALVLIKLKEVLQTGEFGTSAGTLEETRDLIEQVVKYTRSLTFELSPPLLHEFGLRAALEWLARQFQERYGLLVVVRDDGRSKPLDGETRILLFNAVRELLINVVKHARARRTRIVLSRRGGAVRLEVADDGVGFDPGRLESDAPQPKGFGLFHLRERLSHVGGVLAVESHPGRGTRVTLTVPFKPETPVLD